MTPTATTSLSLHYYMENSKRFIDNVDVEWNTPILEWGTNLTGLKQS